MTSKEEEAIYYCDDLKCESAIIVFAEPVIYSNGDGFYSYRAALEKAGWGFTADWLFCKKCNALLAL